MKPQPFFILIVLIAAFIGVVVLLNWAPTGDANKPVRITARKGVVMETAPAFNLITGVTAGEVVMLVRPDSHMTCVWMRESGTSGWRLYPDIIAYDRIAKWQIYQNGTFTDAHPNESAYMRTQTTDYFRSLRRTPTSSCRRSTTPLTAVSRRVNMFFRFCGGKRVEEHKSQMEEKCGRTL